ncbi:alpha/beta hydrolase fold domain-containing protein [Kribbella sp. NPDC026611]|uniref:alpha/beta hydrolase n=1 Tax=Kribbella sp. NPDC026611 TaxID=3154911 RepID=UPI0033C65C26
MNPRLESVLRGALSAVQTNALTPLYALPTTVRRRLAGTPIQIDGNTLDPELQLLLRVESLLPHTTKSDAATARTHLRTLTNLVSGTPTELHRVTALTVKGAAGQLGARLYVPRPTEVGLRPSGSRPTPADAGDRSSGSRSTPAESGARLAGSRSTSGESGQPGDRSDGPRSAAAEADAGRDVPSSAPGEADARPSGSLPASVEADARTDVPHSASAEVGAGADVSRSTSGEGGQVGDRPAPVGAGEEGERTGVPPRRGRSDGPGGLLVFFHGGGWVVGDLETHDGLCRAIAADAGIKVLSVDYRLAPEAPAPTAAEDAIAAFTWAVDHAEDLGVDPDLIAVGGDSAGGNLAAVVAQQCVWRGLPRPALQVLIYPAVDLVARRPSRDLFSEGFILTEHDIIWYRDHYTPDPTIRPDPIVSPLRAEDLSDLPPTYLTTAGFDPLRDEGIAYAQALTAAGNQVTHAHHPALTHGYANLLTLPGTTREAHTHLTTHLRKALH